MSIDSILAIASGAVIGLLIAQFMKEWSFGLLISLLLGLVGGLFGGATFNMLDVMDIGDYADPIIAGVIGAAVVLVVAGAIRRSMVMNV
ncbi:MAG: GlsB/YeaQ/YmgE family stress response membrane protein [Caldilinea sp. CFX5]|nr:GlsB/YeaQ/YmgE family stress response membrane protein [Caldilinea sp. CFX5]